MFFIFIKKILIFFNSDHISICYYTVDIIGV